MDDHRVSAGSGSPWQKSVGFIERYSTIHWFNLRSLDGENGVPRDKPFCYYTGYISYIGALAKRRSLVSNER